MLSSVAEPPTVLAGDTQQPWGSHLCCSSPLWAELLVELQGALEVPLLLPSLGSRARSKARLQVCLCPLKLGLPV